MQLGLIIPISLSLKCHAWPPKVTTNPIYMHGRVWFQRHCDQPGKMVCEHSGCMQPWKDRMSEFECLEDGRCPGAGVQANIFLFGNMLGNLSRLYPDYQPLAELVQSMTQYNETKRPVMDTVILQLIRMVKESKDKDVKASA